MSYSSWLVVLLEGLSLLFKLQSSCSLGSSLHKHSWALSMISYAFLELSEQDAWFIKVVRCFTNDLVFW